MEAQHGDFLLIFLLILLSARIFAEIAARLEIPPVIGQLLAGLIIGPSLLGWVEPGTVVRLMAEIGIILLLFEVGLETDLKRLTNAGITSTLVAAGGFVLPFVLGLAFAHWGMGLELLPSLFIGGTLTATSIGITVSVLRDLKLHQSREGVIVVGAAVVDDVLGVILLALLYEFSQAGQVSLANTGRVALFIAIFFVLAPVVARLMSGVIRRVADNTEIPGLVPTAIVALVLFFAWLAKEAGAPEILGGFAAGLALSRRFFLPFGIALRSDIAFSRRVEEEMRPIVHLFTPVFFVYVGLSLNLHEVHWDRPGVWLLSGGLLVAALAGKMLGALLARESMARRVSIGLAMVPRGEVGLIFVELGRASGILNSEMHAALLIVIALTTLGAPFMLKLFYATRHGRALMEEEHARRRGAERERNAARGRRGAERREGVS